MPAYDAHIVPKSDVLNGHRREHCSAHRSQITTIGRNAGEQVRIERYAPGGVEPLDFALYTVIDMHDEQPDAVFLGYRDPESRHHDLRDRLGLTAADPFTGKINFQVPHPDLSDGEAEECSELVERLTDNGRHRGLIVIAPHGGDIERYTDEQAEIVRERLAPKCISVWLCRGFKKGGGAYDRWHITSIDICPDSFPKLGTVIGRHCEYAVAFHGWDEDSICIGGSAPDDLKGQIRMAVERAILGSGIVVATDADGGCPEGFNGNDPRNIVNRLATNGIQIEQSRQARDRYHEKIAGAVADVIGPKSEVCTAPVFEASSLWTCLPRSIVDIVLSISRSEISSIPCEIKRLLFRLRNCRKGNTDPCIEL